jgi:transposase
MKEFNIHGLDALKPKHAGGRPEKFSEEQKSLIVETALCPPDLLGRPFKRCSLAKLREYFVEEKVLDSISLEALRQILRKHKVKPRCTKTGVWVSLALFFQIPFRNTHHAVLNAK